MEWLTSKLLACLALSLDIRSILSTPLPVARDSACSSTEIGNPQI